MTDTQEAIAAFLAKGGTVNKVSPDASAGMTARDWHKAVRDPVISRDDIDERVAEREYELGAAFGTDGVNDFRLGVAKYGKRAMVGG